MKSIAKEEKESEDIKKLKAIKKENLAISKRAIKSDDNE